MRSPPPDPNSWVRSRYGFALACMVSLLAQWAVLRLVLLTQFRPVPAAASIDIAKAFGVGLERDLFASILLLIPLLLWITLLPERWFAAKWNRLAMAVCLTLFGVGQIFLTFAEFYFFEE